MNDIERRTLITAAGLGTIAALAKAGPLNPPAGAVASTGRTLDEVYNKIPGGDGRIAISTAPFSINSPGSYVVTANLSAAGTVLTISADNVTVDLNGFTLTNTGTLTSTVAINGVRKHVTVRNGACAGGAHTIGNTNTPADVLLEDLTITDGKLSGISLNATNARNCTVRRCRIFDTGSTTTAADGNLSISGIIIGGSNNFVEDCTVSRLYYNGSATGSLRGIFFNGGAAQGGIITRCTVSHDSALTGTGINAGPSCIYRDNTVMNISTAYTGGSNGGGNV